MPEQVVATAPTAGQKVDSKQTALNIANGIQDRAKGKAPAAAAQPLVKEGQQPPGDPTAGDPNSGKEKYVVNGREVWLTPEQAKGYVQKGLAFEPRMDELARLQQEQTMFMRALLTDPGKVLANVAAQHKVPLQAIVEKVLSSNASDDVKEAVGKWFYENAVEPLKLTPDQLKAREDAKWRQEREASDKKAQEDTIRRENQSKVTKAMSEMKAFIGEAMKESGLADPNTPLGAEMARQVADVMRVARMRSIALTPKQAIEHVKTRIRLVQSAYYDSLDDEALAQALGDGVVGKIQKFLLKKAQSNGGHQPMAPKGTPRPAVRNGERKTTSLDEFHDYLDEIKKTGSVPK